MNNELKEDSSFVATRRRWYRRRWAKITWVVVGLVILGFILLAFVPLGGPLNFKLQLAKINATNNFSAGSSVATSLNAGFWLDRVALINLSKQPIMGRVTARIAKHLRTLSMVHTVDVYNGLKNVGPPDGRQQAYDLYITIDMPKLKTSGFMLTGRTVDASIDVAAGDTLWGCWAAGPSDNLAPPTLGETLGMTLKHHSVTTGYQSANARYELVIKNIAKQIGQTLSKHLMKWYRKSGLHPHMPRALYAAPRSVPSGLPLPPSSKLIVALTSHGLMMHNHTVWTMQAHRGRSMLLKLRNRLKAAGWRITLDELQPKFFSYVFDASRGSAVYKAFDVFKKHPPGQSDRLVIDYRDRMSNAEVQPLIAPLLKNPTTSVAILMMVSDHMSPVQHDQLVHRLMTQPHLSAAAQLMLARDLHRRHHDPQAMRRLHDAYAISMIRGHDDSFEIKKLGRKITGDKHWKPKPPDQADFKMLGIPRLNPSQGAKATVSPGQPAVWYYIGTKGRDGKNKVQIVSVTVEPATNPKIEYSVRLVCQSSDGSRFSTVDTPQHRTSPFHDTAYSGLNNLPLSADVTQIAPKRFRVKLSD